VAPPGNQAANGENKPQPVASGETGLLDSNKEMPALSKNLTIMFVDIKGYTSRSYSQTREENQKLLQDFINTVRPIIEKYSGEVVKGLGDALLASFEQVFHAENDLSY
jgi:class 3 adenylate cyclase